MAIVVLHTNNYEDETYGNAILRDVRDEASPESVRAALDGGLYLAVATLEGDDVHAAYRATQNDGPVGSWSREAPVGVVPLGTGAITTPRGEVGYRSSGTGDVFLLDDRVYVAGPRGIVPTEIPAPRIEDLRVVGGGTLGAPAPSR